MVLFGQLVIAQTNHSRWMESGKSSEIKSIDLDRSDNLSEAVIKKFIDQHHDKLEGLVLTGMGQISDMLFITELPKTKVKWMILSRSFIVWYSKSLIDTPSCRQLFVLFRICEYWQWELQREFHWKFSLNIWLLPLLPTALS